MHRVGVINCLGASCGCRRRHDGGARRGECVRLFVAPMQVFRLNHVVQVLLRVLVAAGDQVLRGLQLC